MVSTANQFELDKGMDKAYYIWQQRPKTFFKPMSAHPFISARFSHRINHMVGEVYNFDFNRLRIQSLSIISKQLNETVLKVEGVNGVQYIPVRTDGVYRQIQNRGIYSRKLHQIGIRGSWVSPHILHMNCLITGEPHKYDVTMFFIGKELLVSIREETKRWNRIWVRGRLRVA